jgi:hypothetical protein
MKRNLRFSLLSGLVLILLLISGCISEYFAELPVLTTKDVILVNDTTVLSGGEITDDGGAPVTARGVCWSISRNPELSDSITVDSKGTGSFTSRMSGLTSTAKYYVRSYATNTAGTAYGNEITFKVWMDMPELW